MVEGLIKINQTERNVQKHISTAAKHLPLLENQTRDITSRFQGSSHYVGPVKTFERALEKTQKEYNRNHTRVKDVIRSTIVAKDQKQLEEMVAHMKTAKNLHRHKPQRTNLGYTGHLFNFHYPDGAIGEIQANVPAMIYAKEKESVARNMLGKKYDEVKAKTGMEGGLGHHHYKKWRSLSEGHPDKERLANESRMYYNEISKRYATK